MNRRLPQLVINFLYNLKILKLFSYFNRKKNFVIMLHRILPDELIGLKNINSGVKNSVGFLELLIKYLRSNNYKIVPLNDYYRRVSMGESKLVAFTLDDGYLDNYLYAMPVFNKYNIPFAIFITKNYIDKNEILWWLALEELIMNCESLNTIDLGRLEITTDELKGEAFIKLSQIIGALNDTENLNYLTNLYRMNSMELRGLFMNWEHLKELSKNPLFTLGSHTISHPILSKLNETELATEIIESKKELEEKLNLEIFCFAYPFGKPDSYNLTNSTKYLEEAHYEAAFNAAFGYNEMGENKFDLNRIGFSSNYESDSYIESNLGGFTALLKKFVN